MRLDRKFLLIAPTIVLAFVVAGMVYAAMQLRLVNSMGESWKERSDFLAAVESGQKKLEPRQSMTLLRVGMDVEARRTAAIGATQDLMVALSGMAFVACCVLGIGIRSVPREHWPRMRLGANKDG
jgi:hypothetical protein